MQMNVNTVLLTSQFIGQQRLDYVELQNIVHISENITLASYSFSGNHDSQNAEDSGDQQDRLHLGSSAGSSNGGIN